MYHEARKTIFDFEILTKMFETYFFTIKKPGLKTLLLHRYCWFDMRFRTKGLK